MREVLRADRARRGPGRPPTRVLHRPLGDIKVEGADLAHAVQPRGAWLEDLPDITVRAGDPPGLRQQPLLPRGRDRGLKVQRVDAGVVAFQIPPQQPTEAERQIEQSGVMHRRLTFLQVATSTSRTGRQTIPYLSINWAGLS